MTVVFSDTFAGTDGAALDTGKWGSTVAAGAGSQAVIRTNRAEFTMAGQAYAYVQKDAILAGSLADAILFGSYARAAITEQYATWYLRQSGAKGSESGYAASFENGFMTIYRYVAGAATNLVSTAKTLTAGAINFFRFEAIGTGASVALKFSTWTGTEGDGTTTTITYSDTNAARIVSAGGLRTIHFNGSDGTSRVNFMDDISLDDTLVAAGQPTLRRSINIPHMALGNSAVRRRY